MESPNKKKLRSGVNSTIGGKLGGTSYKTASPYNIKTMNMTNGLSPLMQAAVGGETQTIMGQNIIKDGDNFYYDTGGGDQIYLEDPNNVLEVDGDGYVVDNDYVVEESEDGLVVKDIAKTTSSEDKKQPGEYVDTPSGVPGMGGPMQMASPNKIYSKPKGKRTEY